MSGRPSPEVQAITDAALEQALIGSLLIYPHLVPACVQVVDPSHFWDPNASAAFAALSYLTERELPIDAMAVANEATALRKDFDRMALMDWMARPSASANLVLVAEQVRKLALARRVRDVLVQPRSRLIQHEDPLEVARDAHAALGRLLDGADETDNGITLTAAADVVDRPQARWLIPGLFRERDRMIFVASEGAGKTTLISQLALCAEAGLHPFTRFPVDPIRVLRVDLENGPYSVARSVRLVLGCVQREKGFEQWRPQCPIWERPQGLDLLSPQGQRLLVQAIRRTQPELVFIGPLYKMFRVPAGERADGESLAQALAAFLDDVREQYNVALWIEAHAPKGDGGKHRDLNPIGSSVWYRWPEYGRSFRKADKSKSLRLKGPALDVGDFRGDRDPVSWPVQLVKGHDGWPFTGYYDGDLLLQQQGF